MSRQEADLLARLVGELAARRRAGYAMPDGVLALLDELERCAGALGGVLVDADRADAARCPS